MIFSVNFLLRYRLSCLISSSFKSLLFCLESFVHFEDFLNKDFIIDSVFFLLLIYLIFYESLFNFNSSHFEIIFSLPSYFSIFPNISFGVYVFRPFFLGCMYIILRDFFFWFKSLVLFVIFDVFSFLCKRIRFIVIFLIMMYNFSMSLRSLFG